jgi:hypothetical protein
MLGAKLSAALPDFNTSELRPFLEVATSLRGFISLSWNGAFPNQRRPETACRVEMQKVIELDGQWGGDILSPEGQP